MACVFLTGCHVLGRDLYIPIQRHKQLFKYATPYCKPKWKTVSSMCKCFFYYLDGHIGFLVKLLQIQIIIAKLIAQRLSFYMALSYFFFNFLISNIYTNISNKAFRYQWIIYRSVCDIKIFTVVRRSYKSHTFRFRPKVVAQCYSYRQAQKLFVHKYFSTDILKKISGDTL
jgi:hypothetical protein